jgi:glycosyltransferase involved in cell wall biosynthesis
MKIAIVHDWLPHWGGAESVLQEILACFPEAHVYTLFNFLDAGALSRLKCAKLETSFIQKLPFARSRFWIYLPLMPYAIEQFDLSGYDVVISSSHNVAKGVITGPDQLHISYVHSPIRYAWDLQHEYLRVSNLARGVRGTLARWIFHYLRIWDSRTANGVDAFVANSQFIARRIWKTYRREATVIHPPVHTEQFAIGSQKEDFYVCVCRMVAYKRVDLIVAAFARMPAKRLIVIGDGPELSSIRSQASSNVQILGHQPDEIVRDHLERACALVFAAEEDFGIVLVEAQACGTPVIAYGRGGARETVVPPNDGDPTGLFFTEQTPQAIVAAVNDFERQRALFRPQTCRDNAERFSAARFRQQFAELVATQLDHSHHRR